MIESWKSSRAGAWASRGFHYQHLVSTLILIYQWAGLAPSGHLVPEGLEDCVVELCSHHIWLQIKSRHDGFFSEAEVRKILAGLDAKAEIVRDKTRIRTVVLLEKPCCNVSEVIGVEHLFDRENQKIFISKSPGDEASKILSTQLKIADIIADGIVSDLYRFVAEISQMNASLSFENRKKISSTEVERKIFEKLEAEDSSAIDNALSNGAIEPIDFENPVKEPGFYQGVKVIPGHIASNLVLSRPDDTDNVIRAARQRRHVLISGPSGAGKSALLWLSARILSGEFRWYQITARAVASDADAIIKFIRARRPTEINPIGLAFDEVGSGNSNLWDVLARELRWLSSVYFLGSIRKENIFLISNQIDTEIIQINLDEKLAENVWQRLYDRNQTNWKHWREPFEQSENLMLEYIHILTQGKRLSSVISEQIHQRQRENRHDELAIIRSTAILHIHGGEVQASNLFKLLNITQEEASNALARLIDEHLIRESRPGVLGGLHMLRSQALSKATHDETIFLTTDSLWKSLSAVTIETLPRVIQSIFSGTPNRNEAIALKKLAAMLNASKNIDGWISILTGLGLATLERHVARFIDILIKNNVQRSHWWLASIFSDPHIDIPNLEGHEQWQSLKNAIIEFRKTPKYDLRHACFENLPDESFAPTCGTLKQSNKLFSCLVPICGGEAIRLTIIPKFEGTGEQDVCEVAALLSTAYMIGPDIAENIAQALGGESILFTWFWSQTPWTTMPTIDNNGKNGRTVRADLFHISENIQLDFHDTICEICETLLAISPISDAAASDVVNSAGQPISIGDFIPWSKNIPRENIPAKSRVAWNVAFRQIFLAKASVHSLTDYAQKISELVIRTEKVFRLFTEKWINGKHLPNIKMWVDEINKIIVATNKLSYATPELPNFEMTSPAQRAGKDEHLGTLITGILENLLNRISRMPNTKDEKCAAVYAGSLAHQAETHRDSTIWRTTSAPPLLALDALSKRLKDVSSILHEMAYDNSQLSIRNIIQSAKNRSKNKSISAAAQYCSNLALQRLYGRIGKLEKELLQKGWHAQCCRRQINKLDDVNWPAQEIAILVHINDFEKDSNFINDAFNAGKTIFKNDWRYRVVPILNGKLLAKLALLPSSYMPLPDHNFENEWNRDINLDFFSSSFEKSFTEAVDACMQISMIIACRDVNRLQAKEDDAFSSLVNQFKVNHNLIINAANDTGYEYMTITDDYLSQL